MVPENKVPLPIRTATDADWPQIAAADSRAFGFNFSKDAVNDHRALLTNDRVLLMHDQYADKEHLVGVALDYPMTITAVGGVQIPVPGVSWVSVAATHRRRGILRSLLTAQHSRFVADGAPLSILTASQGAIYGRFGYGPAAYSYTFRIDGSASRFHSCTSDPGGAWQVELEQARRVIPEIHARWAAAAPGALGRTQAWWNKIFADRPEERAGGTAHFFVVHADGYAIYRIRSGRRKPGLVDVVDFVAVTSEARAALWHVLTGIDLFETIEVSLPADDPLPLLFEDSRVARVTKINDMLWLRINDVVRALQLRTYATDLDIVLDVSDGAFRDAPQTDQSGRYRLLVRDGRATVTHTENDADLDINLGDLSSLYLGSQGARRLHSAGRITAHSLDALDAFDRAMTSGTQPFTALFF